MYHGVIDVNEKAYEDGLDRLKETVTFAASLDLSGNALSQHARVMDKQGVCHQLANENRLDWLHKDE